MREKTQIFPSYLGGKEPQFTLPLMLGKTIFPSCVSPLPLHRHHAHMEPFTYDTSGHQMWCHREFLSKFSMLGILAS